MRILLPFAPVFILFISGCSKADHEKYGDLAVMMKEEGMSFQFSDYQPDFHAYQDTFTFIKADGPYKQDAWIIMDGEVYVALYFPGSKPFLDIFGIAPHLAPKSLDMPVRHHNSTLLGSRLTTSVWYDKWAVSGDEHGYSFNDGGDTLALVEWQEWHPEGAWSRKGRSEHRFTFTVDPYFGYTVHASCLLETSDSSVTHPEFTNFMPVNLSNPWDGKIELTYSVYTPAEGEGMVRFTNNMAAGGLSDETKHDWGKGFEVRSGGFFCMAGQDRYSPALLRFGPYRFTHRTCDVWLDQHHHVHVPDSPDRDGLYRMSPEFTFLHIPPRLSNYLILHSQMESFDGAEAVMIRLGVVEDFEKQPYRITEAVNGLTKGWWEKDFVIREGDAWSGSRSLEMEGIPPEDTLDWKSQFIHCPQIPLESNATYRVSAFARVTDDETIAWLSADTYEWTPHEAERLERYSTVRSADKEWTKLELEFTTPGWDPFLDFRFWVVGPGKALFDDLEIMKISE